MLERQRWVIHESAADTVDNLLRGRLPSPQVRTVDENGKGRVVNQLTALNGNKCQQSKESTIISAGRQSNGWRSSGQMQPLPSLKALPEKREFDRLLEQSLNYSGDLNFHENFQMPTSILYLLM